MIAFRVPTPDEKRVDEIAHAITRAVSIAKQCPEYMLLGYTNAGLYDNRDRGDERAL